MNPMPKELALLMVAAMISSAFFLMAGEANAAFAVHEGESIQAAIDSAVPGDIIEVDSGTYREAIDIKKPLTLRGIDSGNGLPFVDVDDGSAIVLSADGIVLEGFSARSSSGWEGDAGILVISGGNTIRNNTVSGSGNAGMALIDSENNTIVGNTVDGNRNEGISLKSCSRNLLDGNEANENRYGIMLESCFLNTIRGNTATGNKFEGIYLESSRRNIVEKNYLEGNWGGISLDNSKDNIVRRNDILGNEKGIRLSYHNQSDSLKSGGKGVYISYNSQSSESQGFTNNTIYRNNLSNRENARDDGLNRWDNGKVGNSYSDFDEPSEGCEGGAGKTCISALEIPGGSSVDRFPFVATATPRKPPGIAGPGGSQLMLTKKSFLPGSELLANFTAPSGFEAWAGIAKVNETGAENWTAKSTGEVSEFESQEIQYLGENASGSLAFAAPAEEGSYQVRMYDGNGTVLLFVPFNVTVARITAMPSEVKTCEKIYVSFSGAPGLDKDWIGMYRLGGSDAVSWQLLNGRQMGTLAFSATEKGSYEFRMFEGDGSRSQSELQPLAKSGPVDVKAGQGVKVIAEPSHVAPGGTITVTYWGAPPSGTGVLGMYGMTRPDKFHIEKRPLGSKSCGSMAFRAPSQPGQYDFRMFENDVYRPIMAMSNVVTVG